MQNAILVFKAGLFEIEPAESWRLRAAVALCSSVALDPANRYRLAPRTAF
jgi:hypothetical protein